MQEKWSHAFVIFPEVLLNLLEKIKKEIPCDRNGGLSTGSLKT